MSVPAVSRAKPAHRRRRSGPAITPVAWGVNNDLDLAEWLAAGRKLGTLGRCSKWWLGDWIRYGNARFGERYARAAAITGYDVQSLMNMVWVASRFETSRRREVLSWSHHESVASLEHQEQERWLDYATKERLSVADLRLELRTARKLADQKASDTEVVSPDSPAVLICPKCGNEVPIREHRSTHTTRR
jgi:predicted RNA-binding Zn-ribbon protein involved in translation (DUF1610 family)